MPSNSTLAGMPEQPAGLVPPGGTYPPLTTLRHATTGPAMDDPLSSVRTADAARAALRAEAETSVLDPVGLRRLWWEEAHLGLFVVAAALMLLVSVQYWSTGETPGWWLFLLVSLPFLNLGTTYLTIAVTRAVPAPGLVPRWGPARWRWYRRLRREPAVVPPPAPWPPGSEAYAVLAGAASVQSVAPAWLAQRVGLPPELGEQWVAFLRRCGCLAGGGRALGLPFLPELHVQVTEAGRARLVQERARLTALATGWPGPIGTASGAGWRDAQGPPAP